MANQLLSQIEYAVRNKLNSQTTRRFDQRSIITWINEALDDIARRSEGLRTSTSVAITAGTQSVTAPERAVRVHMVYYKRNSDTQRYDLEYRDIKNMASIAWTKINETEGTPALFWTWGYPPALTVNVYPIPSETGTLEIFYYSTPATLATDGSAASTSVDIPGGWEDMIVDYATFQALLSSSDDRFQVFQQIYERKLAALTDATTRFTDQAGAIDNGNRMVPYWLYGDGDF